MCESERIRDGQLEDAQRSLERACGRPVSLNVHSGGLIITDDASGET